MKGIFCSFLRLPFLGLLSVGSISPGTAQLPDDFESAGEILFDENSRFEQFLEGGSVEVGEAPGIAPGRGSFWGKWTAPADGVYVLQELNDFGVDAAIFESKGKSSLRLLTTGRAALHVGGGVGDSIATLLRFRAEKDKTYLIRFFGTQSQPNSLDRPLKRSLLFRIGTIHSETGRGRGF